MSLLSIDHATKRFGGLTAVDGVSFDLAAGEIVGLLGPNGSGKTTLVNLISGNLASDGGQIALNNVALTGKRPDQIARLGVARTFQLVRILPSLTLTENVMIPAVFGAKSHWGAEAERVATRHKLPMLVVSNGGIRPSANPLVETVIVAAGADEADKWIAERCGAGDIVVTGDIPLAAKCIEAGAQVLKHNGEALTAKNIGNVLATRDLMADLRAADPFRQGGGKAFTKQDRSRFLEALEREMRKATNL